MSNFISGYTTSALTILIYRFMNTPDEWSVIVVTFAVSMALLLVIWLIHRLFSGRNAVKP